MAKAFTTKSIEAMKPDPENRREVPDPALSGLYLVIQTSGAKSWALRYRYGGKPRKLTLGKVPALSLADARKEATKALGAIERGRDPGIDKKLENAAQRAGDTKVRTLIGEFDKRYLSKLKTRKAVRQSLDHNVTPIIGDMDVKDVTRQDVVRLLERIADAGKGTTANRVKAYLSKFMGWCQDRGVIEQSPMIGLGPISDENRRERPLSLDEVALIWKVCELEPMPYGALFKMLILTGQRRGEVATMKWADVDDSGVWRLSSTKNAQRHDVPLSASAIRLLEALPRIGDYIFTTNGKTPSTSLSKPHARLSAKMVELAGHDIPHWTPHDIRHTVKTQLAAMGVPLDIRSRLTNHLSDIPVMDRRYNHAAYEQEKRDALNAWANHLATLVNS